MRLREILIMMLGSQRVRVLLTDHCHRKNVEHEPLKKLHTEVDNLHGMLTGKAEN